MNRNAEWCQRCIEAVYLPPLSDEELIEKESKVAAVRARDEGKRDLFEGEVNGR